MTRIALAKLPGNGPPAKWKTTRKIKRAIHVESEADRCSVRINSVTGSAPGAVTMQDQPDQVGHRDSEKAAASRQPVAIADRQRLRFIKWNAKLVRLLFGAPLVASVVDV